jgi:hypothetical protein
MVHFPSLSFARGWRLHAALTLSSDYEERHGAYGYSMDYSAKESALTDYLTA